VWISVGNLYELSIFCWILIGGLPAGGDVEIHFKIKKKKILLVTLGLRLFPALPFQTNLSFLSTEIFRLFEIFQLRQTPRIVSLIWG
jgi:hypothetical protein